IELSFDGTSYRTDLCEDHAAELAAALDPFLSSAERVEGRSRVARPADGRSTTRPPTRRDPMQVAATRESARATRYEIPDTGRLPAAPLAETRWRWLRSAGGPGPTATRSRIAGASPATSKRRTTPAPASDDGLISVPPVLRRARRSTGGTAERTVEPIAAA